MDLVTVFVSFGVVIYFFYKVLKNDQLGKAVDIFAKNAEINSRIIEEIQKRERIIKRVEEFVRNSELIEEIGSYDGLPVFKYVANGGVVYKFDDFLTDKTDKIGIDFNELCFNRKRYIRLD